MKKFVGIILISAILLSGLLIPNTVSANSEIIINGNELDTFKNRTKENISEEWEKGKISDYDSIYEEGKEASFVAPYSGGTVKTEVLEDIQDNLNYYRWLCGCPKITSKVTHRQDLQNATVLQYINLCDRENGVGLTHTLRNYPKPDDMSEEFYESAVGAGHTIISTYSYKSSIRGFFSESIFTYTNGHRLDLLYPSVSLLNQMNHTWINLQHTLLPDTFQSKILPEDLTGIYILIHFILIHVIPITFRLKLQT